MGAGVKERGLFVVEDAAHALGSRFGLLPIGGDSRSDAVVFSFYATKSLTTGEGGMIATHRSELWAQMRAGWLTMGSARGTGGVAAASWSPGESNSI